VAAKVNECYGDFLANHLPESRANRTLLFDFVVSETYDLRRQRSRTPGSFRKGSAVGERRDI
jgi:hypothetical protein